MCDEVSGYVLQFFTSPSLEPRGVGLCSFQDLAEGEWPQEGRWMDRFQKKHGGLGIGDDDFTGNQKHIVRRMKRNISWIKKSVADVKITLNLQMAMLFLQNESKCALSHVHASKSAGASPKYRFIPCRTYMHIAEILVVFVNWFGVQLQQLSAH